MHKNYKELMEVFNKGTFMNNDKEINFETALYWAKRHIEAKNTKGFSMKHINILFDDLKAGNTYQVIAADITEKTGENFLPSFLKDQVNKAHRFMYVAIPRLRKRKENGEDLTPLSEEDDLSAQKVQVTKEIAIIDMKIQSLLRNKQRKLDKLNKLGA